MAKRDVDLDAIAASVSGPPKKGPASPWEPYRAPIAHWAKMNERGEMMMTRIYDALKIWCERQGMKLPVATPESLCAFIRRERQKGKM